MSEPPDPALVDFSAPDRLAALPDGRRIHLYCRGEGAPTVILTAGVGSWSSAWDRVIPAVARKTQVCAWDRAGFGFSDASDVPQTLDHTEADLEAALTAAGIGGPYLLVAESAGSYETLLFADRHRGQVAGMMLADPSVPDQLAIADTLAPPVAQATRRQLEAEARLLRSCAARLADPGLRDAALKDALCLSYSPQFPGMLEPAAMSRNGDPARLMTKASLYESFETSSRLAENPTRLYGAMPLLVLTAERAMVLPKPLAGFEPALTARWRLEHDRLAALSTDGRNRLIAGAAHDMEWQQPQIVIGAIDEVLAEIKH